MQTGPGAQGQPVWNAGLQAAYTRRREAVAAKLKESAERVAAGGGKPDEAWLPVLDLRVDPAYQRTGTRIDQQRVLEMALDWQWSLCGKLVVNLRPDGSFYILDGGHRKEAFVMLNQGPMLAAATLPCLVLHLTSVEEEARLFDLLNDLRVAVSYDLKFKARLLYGEYYAVTTIACIQAAGLTPAFTRDKPAHKAAPGDVQAINTCERILRQTDDATLSTVLGLLMAAWGKDPWGYHRALLMAVYDFHVRFAGEYAPKELTSLLRRLTPKGTLEAAPVEAAPQQRAVRISLYLHEQYNRKRSRGRLTPFALDGASGFGRVLRGYKRKRAAPPAP